MSSMKTVASKLGRKSKELLQPFSIPSWSLFSLPRHWKQSGLLALDLCFIPFAGSSPALGRAELSV